VGELFLLPLRLMLGVVFLLLTLDVRLLVDTGMRDSESLWFLGVRALEVGVANLWGVLSVLPAVNGAPGSFWWCGGFFLGILRALLTEEVGDAGLLDDGVLLVI